MTDTAPMSTYLLPNVGDKDVEFTGILLGESSTADGEKDRWSEARIYRTRGGKYICETVGRSNRPGEVDISRVRIADTPADLVAACFTTSSPKGKPYLPNFVYNALLEAADLDPAVADAIVVKVD